MSPLSIIIRTAGRLWAGCFLLLLCSGCTHGSHFRNEPVLVVGYSQTCTVGFFSELNVYSDGTFISHKMTQKTSKGHLSKVEVDTLIDVASSASPSCPSDRTLVAETLEGELVWVEVPGAGIRCFYNPNLVSKAELEFLRRLKTALRDAVGKKTDVLLTGLDGEWAEVTQHENGT